jgi:hypothetical protein
MLSKKIARFNRILPKIEKEVGDISCIIQERDFFRSNYNLHKVPVAGASYLAADAKAMNRYDHQSGRGCWRYLFDSQTRQYAGIAREVDSGSYQIIA